MQTFGTTENALDAVVRRQQESDPDHVYSLIYDKPENVALFKSRGYEVVTKGESVDGITRIGDAILMRVTAEQYNKVQQQFVLKDHIVRDSYRRSASNIAAGESGAKAGTFFHEPESEP